MPSESADVVLEQALATKLGKLVAAPVAKRVLLLEKASLVRGSSEIGDAVEALRSDFSDLAKIDEVWVIDTVALATENYTASYLVWPPAEAHNFEDWRHAVSST
jgi:hypothetical protein